MTGGGFEVRGNVLMGSGYQPFRSVASFRAEWNGGPESTPGQWIPAFAGMTVGWFVVRGDVLMGCEYQPFRSVASFRTEWGRGPESAPR